MAPPETIPFSALPLNKAGPFGNAWGRFGDKDQLGTLNLLTPERKKAAAAEIKEGISISLDWSLDMPTHPIAGRQKFYHTILTKAPRTENDDIIYMNTQSSSQWDGHRHFGYQEAKQFYNGHTLDEFIGSDVLGLNVWLENGGIVGRGVLLDFASWAEKKGIQYDPFTRYPITPAQLREMVADEGITFETGDVLFIRSGFIAAYEKLNAEERAALPFKKTYIGVESCIESAEWLWEQQFAAVAGDMPGFEQTTIWGSEVQLHQWVLAGWGMPIGELFYLEHLARACNKLQRNTFFLTSMPLRIPGGVASPPNAVAIL